jgi:hypothetical protein
VSRSLTASSVGKLELSLRRGLASEETADVMLVMGDGVDGRSELEGLGENGGERDDPTDIILREGGVGASAEE